MTVVVILAGVLVLAAVSWIYFIRPGPEEKDLFVFWGVAMLVVMAFIALAGSLGWFDSPSDGGGL